MSQTAVRRLSWMFGLLFLTVAGLVVVIELDPVRGPWMIGPRTWVDIAFAALSFAAGLGTIAFGVLRARRTDWPRSVQLGIVVVLAALCFTAGVTYFYGIRGVTTRVYLHTHDAYHYFIGPKYYAELDYDQLYECTVAATSGVAREGTKFRDLKTLKVEPLGKRKEEFLERCKPLFSPERWQEFESDLALFAKVNRSALRSGIGDLGYNGTPFNALLAGSVANALSSVVTFSPRTLQLLPLIDIALLCWMLMMVTRGFGARLALLAAVFLFTAVVDRHAIIGCSFLRYTWLVTLVLGIVALQQKRYATAGVWLALSAVLNVFPVLFAAAIPIKALFDVARRRPLAEGYKRFMIAGICTAAVCLALGASHARHLGNYDSFIADMKQHDVHNRTPGFGVGLKFDVIQLHRVLNPGVKADRPTRLGAMKPLWYAGAALLLGALIALLPKLEDVEASILLGFALVFCLFGPTSYYYAFAFLLVLAWRTRTATRASIVFLTALFWINVGAYAVLHFKQDLFYVLNTVVSLGWTAYFVALLVYLAIARKRVAASAGDEPQTTEPASVSA